MGDDPSTPVLHRVADDTVVRRAGPEDVDAVVALNVDVFGPQDGPGVRALLEGPVDVEWLVAATGPDADRPGGGTVAAACARIPHRFALDGVELGGSQIENVTTDARFRGRGLVRALFAAHHARADADGELLQVVGGIPFFYRKLGYGYGFDVPPTWSIAPGAVPATDRTRVQVRPARTDDVAWIVGQEPHRRRDGLTVVRDEAAVATWVARTRPVDGVAWEGLTVAELDGRPVGWLRTVAWAAEAQMFLLPGAADDVEVAGQLVGDAVARAQAVADRLGHPLELLASDLPGTPWSRAVQAAGRPRPEPSGYYVRVADEVALLRALRPALDRRLQGSGLVADRGELTLSLYERGLRLAWRDGQVAEIEPAPPDPDPFDKGGAGVAPDWFPALALGRWGASGLAARTDDTLLGDHASVLDVLFPARPTDVVVDL